MGLAFISKRPTMLKKIAIITQDLLFSRYCYLCQRPRAHLFAFCRPCLARLPYIHQHCPTCGIELLTQQQCGQCLQKRCSIHQTIPTFRYDALIKDAILQLKYHQGLHLSQALAQLMHHKLRAHYQQTPWPEALICVPLQAKKMRVRGYNQTQALAKHLSLLTNIEDMSQSVKKIRITEDQSSLPLNERKANIKNAFGVHQHIAKHVAIIDDVMTTGTTVKQLAITLKKHGAKTVDVWCLARTPLPHLK